MKLAVALLVLLMAGCASSESAGSSDADPPIAPGAWLAMAPGDALAFDGPGGELVLIHVDETYDLGAGTYASALTWALGDEYTTDYLVEDDDGTVWWYGRRGEWRAGRKGEKPRAVEIVDHRATFGAHVITLSEDGVPVRLETPDGVYR